jgi:hypothetical protein
MWYSGLAWHTTDETLREGFQQFGNVEEAVGCGKSHWSDSSAHLSGRSSSRTETLNEVEDSASFASRTELKPTMLSPA